MIGNYNSKAQNISSDVPQGLVQGPLWFLIFINDYSNDIKSKIKLFLYWVSLTSSNSSRAIMFTFVLIPLEKYEPPYNPSYGWNNITAVLYKDAFGINYNPYAIKQRNRKLFADDVKLLFRSLAKETIQMYLNYHSGKIFWNENLIWENLKYYILD